MAKMFHIQDSFLCCVLKMITLATIDLTMAPWARCSVFLCTAHVVNKKKDFISYDQSHKPEDHNITLADGSMKSGVAEDRGTAAVGVIDINGKEHKITLLRPYLKQLDLLKIN